MAWLLPTESTMMTVPQGHLGLVYDLMPSTIFILYYCLCHLLICCVQRTCMSYEGLSVVLFSWYNLTYYGIFSELQELLSVCSVPSFFCHCFCLIIGLHLQVPVFEQISDNQWGIRCHCSPYTWSGPCEHLWTRCIPYLKKRKIVTNWLRLKIDLMDWRTYGHGRCCLKTKQINLRIISMQKI